MSGTHLGDYAVSGGHYDRAAERRHVLGALREAAKKERQRLKDTNPLYMLMQERATELNMSQGLQLEPGGQLPDDSPGTISQCTLLGDA